MSARDILDLNPDAYGEWLLIKRIELAGLALAGLCANPDPEVSHHYKGCAVLAVEIADQALVALGLVEGET